MKHSDRTPAHAPPHRAAAEHAAPAQPADMAGAFDRSPRVTAQRQAVDGLQRAPATIVQQRRVNALRGAAGGPAHAQHGRAVVQGAFIVGGVPIAGAALTAWIDNNVPKGRPEVAAMIRLWDQDANYATDHASDLAAYTEAESKAQDKILSQNSTVAHQIVQGAPHAVPWANVPVWGAWYFSGLEYQDNKTGGWHANRQGWLPHGATVDGRPTRYVEFRRPGAVGEKEDDKLERCIFDLLTGGCWPNAHYDGGYVEITGVPAPIKNRLLTIAYAATGMKDRAERMTPPEIVAAGAGFAKIQWLLNTLDAEIG